MRRREFIASVAALGAWSASVRAQQQTQRLRKLGIIMAVGKTPEYVAALAALEKALSACLVLKTARICGSTSAGRRRRACRSFSPPGGLSLSILRGPRRAPELWRQQRRSIRSSRTLY
jgi:hypothetical protein